MTGIRAGSPFSVRPNGSPLKTSANPSASSGYGPAPSSSAPLSAIQTFRMAASLPVDGQTSFGSRYSPAAKSGRRRAIFSAGTFGSRIYA